MPTKRIISDADFGQIIIRTHRLARNISMRIKDNGLHITVPPMTHTTQILKVVENYRTKLLENWEKQPSPIFDLTFCINTPCFRLRVEQGAWKYFTVRTINEETIIYAPKDVDFTLKTTQDLLKKAVIRALKRKAENDLPILLKEHSKRHELPYKRVKITGSKRRWGSCSSTKSINLSCYLMLLPPHLADYVMLHELAHTREMNHGSKFWNLLNQLTNGMAHQLRNELRKHKSAF